MNLFSTKSLVLSDFEQFSADHSLYQEAIIGRQLLGSRRFKAISFLSLQHYSGETKFIVNNFKEVLVRKYGTEIANFAFTHEYEEKALSKGLTRKTIATVLKKAVILEKSDCLNYLQALQTKKHLAIKIVKKLKGTLSYVAAQKKYQLLEQQLQKFHEKLTGTTWDQCSPDYLRQYFQKKIPYVDDLARSVIALSDTENKIKKIFGTTQLSKEMFEVFLKHQEVMEELKDELKKEVDGTWSSSTLRAAMTEVGKSLDPLIKTIKKSAVTLSAFSKHFDEENFLSYFSLNQRGEVILQDQIEKNVSTQKAQQHAASIFFDALKKCYGIDFINELQPKENQNHPLRIGEAVEIFKKVKESFKNLAAFFQKQPLLITEEYLDVLLMHPHLAEQVERDYSALGLQEKLLLRETNIGVSKNIVSAMMISADLIPINTISAHLVIGAFHCSPVLLAVGIGALTGVAWAYMSGYQKVAGEAASISTIYTLEGTLAEIATEAAIPGSTWGAYLARLFSDRILSGAIHNVVSATGVMNAIHNAFIGGVVSGVLASRTDGYKEDINIANELSLEERLGVRYAFEKLIEAISGIPIDAASVEVMLSRRINL